MSQHVSDRLTAFIHAELGEADVRAIEGHLATCEACRGELAELQRVDALAAGLTRVEVPDDLWAAIATELPARRRGPRRFVWGVAAAAAIVILAVAVGLLLERDSAPAPTVDAAGWDVAAFLTELEATPRQADSREFGLRPAGFADADSTEAARNVGLADDAGRGLAAQLFGARVLSTAEHEVYELIYGNDDGVYLLFAAPLGLKPELGPRKLEAVPSVSPTCAGIESDGFAVYWDAGETLQWILVGRDHAPAFYEEVMRFVVAARPPSDDADDGTNERKEEP